MGRGKTDSKQHACVYRGEREEGTLEVGGDGEWEVSNGNGEMSDNGADTGQWSQAGSSVHSLATLGALLVKQQLLWDFCSQTVLLLFSKTEADGFKQHLSSLNARVSDTVKKFTLDPQNNPKRDKTIRPV